MMKDFKVWRVLEALIAFSLLMAQPIMAYEKEIKSLALTMGEKIAKAGKKIVAAVDFTDLQGNVTELGRFLAEEFSVALADTGGAFEVVDRIHLKIILQEHKLALTELIDPSTAKKLGQIAGVQSIITGVITPFEDSVRLSIKVLDTDTARIISASSTNIAKTKAIEELLARGIETKTQTFTPQIPVKVQDRVEAMGFIFELEGCSLSGGNVTCLLSITSKDKDRWIRVFGEGYASPPPSIIFDNFGNEYHARKVRLANKEGSAYVDSLLISGVPTKISLSFEGVSPEATMITRFDLSCRSDGDFTVQFRNIQLIK